MREFWILKNAETGERIVNQDDGPRYWEGIRVRQVSEAEDAAVRALKKQLKAVLSWPLPGKTTVGEYSIPPWMLEDCEEALAAYDLAVSGKG